VHLINNILETGVTKTLDQYLIPRIKVINSACLIGIVATIVANISMYATGTFNYSLFALFICVFTFPLIANNFKKYALATFTLFIGAIIAINFTMVAIPDKLLYYFIPIAVLPYFFQNRKRRLFFLIILIILPFIVSKFFHLDFQKPGEFRFIYFFITVGTTIFMIHQFVKVKRENLKLTLATMEEFKKTKAMISNRKRKLEYMNQKFTKQNTELENLVYIASHDLKEPIRNTISYIQLLKKKNADKLSSQNLIEIKKLESNAFQINNTISELLSYSQIGNTADFETFNLKILITECLASIYKKYQRSIEVVHDLDIDIYGNREDIKILFIELFSISIQTHKDKADLKIEIKASRNGNHTSCHYKDNGQYTNLNNQLKEGNLGKFGLTICNKIVYYHEGTLQLESHPDTGLNVHFTLNAKNPISN